MPVGGLAVSPVGDGAGEVVDDVAAGARAAFAEQAAALLTCPICFDLLLRPVVTPCGHSYCLKCFEGWRTRAASAATASGRGLACPVCRTALPQAWQAAQPAPLSPAVALTTVIAELCPHQDRERRLRQHHEEQEEAQRRARATVEAERSASDVDNDGALCMHVVHALHVLGPLPVHAAFQHKARYLSWHAPPPRPEPKP